MHPSSPEAPAWIQYVIVSAGAVAVFVSTLVAYLRKGKEADRGSEVAVVSATFADRRTIEHLTDTIDRLERTINDEREERRRERAAIIELTDALINITHFMRRNDP
jgi:hypothetical protein